MTDLIYMGHILDIPIFIDDTIKPNTAYMLDLSKAIVDGEQMCLGGQIILINNIGDKK